MYTDPIEEACLKGGIPLRQLMRLAVVTAPTHFTNVEEIVDVHLETYKGKFGYRALPDYVRHYAERTVGGLRALQCAAHA